jgi:hypothetical protein
MALISIDNFMTFLDGKGFKILVLFILTWNRKVKLYFPLPFLLDQEF